MSDFIAVLLIAYVQGGLLLAWYLFYRRALALREDFGASQAANESLLRKLEIEVCDLRRQMQDLAGIKRRPRHTETQILQQAKRRGALEMARRGMGIVHIAETLKMQRAEVEMLVRLERLQRDGHPQVAFAAPNWIETAS